MASQLFRQSNTLELLATLWGAVAMPPVKDAPSIRRKKKGDDQYEELSVAVLIRTLKERDKTIDELAVRLDAQKEGSAKLQEKVNKLELYKAEKEQKRDPKVNPPPPKRETALQKATLDVLADRRLEAVKAELETTKRAVAFHQAEIAQLSKQLAESRSKESHPSDHGTVDEKLLKEKERLSALLQTEKGISQGLREEVAQLKGKLALFQTSAKGNAPTIPGKPHSYVSENDARILEIVKGFDASMAGLLSKDGIDPKGVQNDELTATLINRFGATACDQFVQEVYPLINEKAEGRFAFFLFQTGLRLIPNTWA
jgi:uncharacterized phage infection (PIP) family protein YhgE